MKPLTPQGERLRKALQIVSLTQKQLAQEAGVTEKIIGWILTKPGHPINPKVLAVMEHQYGFYSKWLETGQGETRRRTEVILEIISDLVAQHAPGPLTKQKLNAASLKILAIVLNPKG